MSLYEKWLLLLWKLQMPEGGSVFVEIQVFITDLICYGDDEMKNKILLLCFLFVIAVNSRASSVGDSASYNTYFSQFPQMNGSVLKIVTALDPRSGDFTYTQQMDAGKPHSFTASGMLNKAYESALETCDAMVSLPVKGVKEAITTPAGTFPDACHYIIDTYNEEFGLHKHREVFIGAVPFYIIKEVNDSLVTVLVKINKNDHPKE